MLNFVKCFLWSCDFYPFIIVVYHIDWFADIEPSLHHFIYVNIYTKFKWIFPRLSSILRNQCRSSWSVEYVLLFPVISSCYLISVNSLVTLHNQTWNLIVIFNISILFSHPWYLLVFWSFLSLLLCLLNPIPLHCTSEKYKFHFYQQYVSDSVSPHSCQHLMWLFYFSSSNRSCDG